MTENTNLVHIGGRAVEASGSLKDMVKKSKERPIMICDRSGSMAERVVGGPFSEGERKIDALRRILSNLRQEADFLLMQFDNEASFVDGIDEPRGGTNLAGALELAATKNARRYVLICDGWPDNPGAALAAAAKLPAPLDVFYVGPETDTHGKAFMAELAKAGRGEFGAARLDQKELENKVRLALTVGSPEDIAKGPIAL